MDVAPFLLALLALFVVIMRKRNLGKTLQSKPVNAVPDEAKVESDKPRVMCFFGSQTGTAEGYAKEVVSDLNKNGFNAKPVDLEEFDVGELRDDTPLALFFMATYGEGEPCDNSLEFTNFLKDKTTEENFASKIKFSVFGLGNTQYEHYNSMGKLVNSRLTELGGELIHPYGEGDDDKDLEEDFGEWRQGLVDAFRLAAGLEMEAGNGSAHNPQEMKSNFDFNAVFVPQPQNESHRKHGGRVAGSKDSFHEADLSSRHFFQSVKSKIVDHRELRQKTLENGGLGSTVHVEFDLEGTGLSYRTADNLTVCPANDAKQVRETVRYLRLDAKQWFVLESNTAGTKPLFPTPCTIETALTYFTDLNGAPTRSLLEKLAPLATLVEHRDRLLFLASKSGKADFTSYIASRHLSICEIFETFPSFKITDENLGAFFQIMPRLKGRDFTIASSSNMQPSRIALTVGVVQETKPGAPEGRVLNGVCSTFIKSQNIGSSESLVFVKESTFKLPSDPKVPIILIGPGTGIAPMRAFIQERKYQRTILKQETGDTILFFGCRKEDEDFIYKEELMEALDTGALTKLHTAFSRQQSEKVYVQHVMLREKARLWEYIHDQGAHVYVCGATSMGKDVSLALQSIVQEYSGVEAESAKKYLTDLQQQHRYIQELWSS